MLCGATNLDAWGGAGMPSETSYKQSVADQELTMPSGLVYALQEPRDLHQTLRSEQTPQSPTTIKFRGGRLRWSDSMGFRPGAQLTIGATPHLIL